MLKRQLMLLGLDPEAAPSDAEWTALLDRVAVAYATADEERYLLERSLAMTSEEMNGLYASLQESSQQSIAAERDKLRAVIDSLLGGLCIVGPDGRLAHANPTAREVLKLADEPVGQPMGEVMAFVFRSGEVLDIRSVSEPRRDDAGRLDRWDGVSVPVEFTVGPILTRGTSVGWVVAFNDATQRRRAQHREQELNAKLARSERLESLGALASGVAHDLNNILGPMVSLPTVITAELPPRSPLKADLALIEESARRAAAVIGDLLSLARRGRYAAEPVAVNELVEQFLRSVDLRVKLSESPGVVVHTDLAEDLPELLASWAQVNQILLNLSVHGLASMDEGGILHVKTRYERLPASKAVYDRIPSGEYVVLEVSDTGKGFPENALPRLFEPFFSRKELDRPGTGLGLTIVHGAVRDSGAFIDVQSSVGQGACFSVWFPVKVDAEAPEVGGGNETVLVVDDVALQRRMARKVLVSLGYRVEVARTGREAVAWLRDNDAELVLLDMVMESDFDGLDTLMAIQEIRPQQRCVLVTGYAGSGRVQQALELGAGKCLAKPYTQNDLADAVRLELDRG